MILNKLFGKKNETDEDRCGRLFGIIFGLAGGIFGAIIMYSIIGSDKNAIHSYILFFISMIFLIFIATADCEDIRYRILSGLSFGTSFLFITLIFNFNKIFPSIHGWIPIASIIFVLITLTEVIFIMYPQEKVKKRNIMKHTLLKKGEAMSDAIIISIVGMEIYGFGKLSIKYLSEIIKWVGYIGAGIIVLGIIGLIFYGWIKLNSIKYQNA